MTAPRRWRSLIALTLACVAIATTLNGCAASTHTSAPSGNASAAAIAIESSVLLLEAADSEALYTLAGGLKPMSSGFWRGSFTVDEPDLAELRATRAALAPLRNDVWYADVQVFDNMFEGRRSVHAYVVHRASLASMIERYAAFWNRWGVTPGTHPSEVVAVVDRMPRADRWRGYGYLFGYPAEAVDFFVEAGLAADADEQREVGPGKDRRFVHIPTYGAETGRFTYAVALDHVETSADEALASEAQRILEAYTERRDRMRDLRSTLRELRRLNDRFGGSAATHASHAATTAGSTLP